jgi:prepilin-type N-terminal cleavage/methylation domain-containing protein
MNKSRQMAFTAFRPAQNGQQGLTLIEILVALGIIAAVAAVFLAGMATSSKAVIISQERVAAESLSKSELEYVKSLAYRDATWSYTLPSDPPSWDLTHALPDGYAGYSIQVDATQIEIDPDNPVGDDDGLQRITININYRGDPSFTLVGYKVKQ